MPKTVLITGAAKGIGAATADVFASHGYDVIINYHTSEKLAEDLKNKLIEQYKVNVVTIKADISKEEDVKKMLNIAMKKFGKIDVLINNAALALDDNLEDKRTEDFEKVLLTNLVGPFLTCKYFGEQMKEQKYGKIVNVASTNGIDTYAPYSADYDASKAGLISLTHNFAVHLAPFVNVNAVAPGWTNTEAVQKANPMILEKEKQKILLKRFAEPKEIANVIYFLTTEEAKYINSEVIRIDGGIYQ